MSFASFPNSPQRARCLHLSAASSDRFLDSDHLGSRVNVSLVSMIVKHMHGDWVFIINTEKTTLEFKLAMVQVLSYDFISQNEELKVTSCRYISSILCLY